MGGICLKPVYLTQPSAWFHSRILVGPGAFLTRSFVVENNITAVINCAFPEHSPEWYQLAHPLRYICLSAIDSSSVYLLDWYPQFERYMRDFLRNTTGVVYVHCQAGMNRSAFLALAYVCKHFGLDFELSLRKFQIQRPCMFQNETFKGQVKEFINGHLQSPEGSGRVGYKRYPWDTRFLTSRTGVDAPRILGSAGKPYTRTQQSKVGSLPDVFDEQSGRYIEGELETIPNP